MTILNETHETRGLLHRLRAWLSGWRERTATLAGLAGCGDAETARIAHDLGLAAGELRVLAGKWPDAADLLRRRANVLGIDVVEIERTQQPVMRDMQRVCSICDNHRVCAHDLDRKSRSAAWRGYCPNAETLDAVCQERANAGGGKAD